VLCACLKCCKAILPCRETSAMFAGAGMMAADGRCKTLDDAADGYVRGEACVVVKLRYAQ
jgi:acyl transferase domain-containing protein